MEWLTGLYIATTVFGAGVTLADMIGVFSNVGEGDGDDGGAEGDTDFEGDGAEDFDGDGGDETVEATGEGDEAGEEAVEDADEEGSMAGHDRRQRRSVVIGMLTALRTAVYFSLGFGPVGWFATTQYASGAATLAWSVPVGVVVAVGTRALRSFMRRDLSSTVQTEELLMERGTVTVSIAPGQVGKIRVQIAGVYVDRYAKSRESELLPPGSEVRIVDVDDEYVYVESERR